MWIWDSGANLCVTRTQQNPTEPAARPSGTPTEPAADPPEPAAEAGTCRGPDQNPAGPTPAELGTCRARPESSRAHCGALQQSRGPSRSWPWALPFFAGSLSPFVHLRGRSPAEPAGTRGGTRGENATVPQPPTFFDSNTAPGTRRNPLRNPRFLQDVLSHLLILCLHTVTLLYYY